MVRAPCCEKMGLKKGPWTPEEDQILVAHIRRHGHGNWRALPKQAGLPRCGKSCRLRWINYLRPDIKRGNFTREEEDTIIRLHELLGNRWSAIAARLPGRTDNEIKNVWHTHLKKRLVTKPVKTKCNANNDNTRIDSMAVQKLESRNVPVSSEQSLSSVTESSMVSAENSNANTGISACAKEESFSSEEFQFDESFWSEALSLDNVAAPMDVGSMQPSSDAFIADPSGSHGFSSADDMDFWLRVFMEAGDMKDLPQI